MSNDMNNDLICFDTESAQGRSGGRYKEELLEISIMNGHGDTIFYHRFKPATLKKWDPSVHHITPDMVKGEKPVKEYRKELQALIDNSDYIIGFSLIDDFKALENAGLKNLRQKPQVELRNLYWYCVARHQDIPFHSGPNLSKCADQVGVKVDTEAVHSACGDTRVTLNLFYELMRLFLIGEGIITESSEFNFAHLPKDQVYKLIELALKRIAEAKYEYDRKCAAGYVHVVSEEGGVMFTPSLNPEFQGNNLVLTIQVAARRKAIYELETMFERRRSKAMKKIFHLSKGDLESVAAYQNEFDGNEQLYQKLTGLRRAGINH